MQKQSAVMETSFWVLGHRVDVLSYLFRLFTVVVPEAVRVAVWAADPRYPQRVCGYQEMFRLLEDQGALSIRNPPQRLPQFHAGAAAERARLPVAVLLEEMGARKVAVLEDADAFGPGLEALRGAFGECP